VIWVNVHRFRETTTNSRLEGVVMEPEIRLQLRFHWLGGPCVQLYLGLHSNPFSRFQGDGRILTVQGAIQFNSANTESLHRASTKEADFESEAEI
jgi:hypothetical protein